MAERHTIETYGGAPHNRNIWSTAKQWKHMVHSQTIETYGRHAWPILLFGVVTAFIPLLWCKNWHFSVVMFRMMLKIKGIKITNALLQKNKNIFVFVFATCCETWKMFKI